MVQIESKKEDHKWKFIAQRECCQRDNRQQEEPDIETQQNIL